MKIYFESRRDKKLNLHKNVGSRICEGFKFKSGDTAYTMAYAFDNGKKAVYVPVKIKDAWFDDVYGNQYSLIEKDGSINSSCPEEFLLTEYELQKELDSGCKLVENKKLKESSDEDYEELRRCIECINDAFSDGDYEELAALARGLERLASIMK